MRNKCRQAGFTLVELLVAMTLLALLSVSLFGSLRFGARSWEAVAESAANQDEIASTQAFLRGRLSELWIQGPVRQGRFGQERSFSGSSSEMEFTAPWLSALSLGGLYQFTVWYEDEGDGRLMLAWDPVEADSEELETLEDITGRRILLSGISDFELSYYGAEDEDAEPEWLDNWDNPDAPPRLVRIELAFAGGARKWPVFVVAPKF